MPSSEIKKLPPLKGTAIKISQSNFKSLGDFLFHEGPLISHMVNLNNEDYIMKWCDVDSEVNRWMLYKTNYSLLHQYFQKKLNDQDLLLKNPDGFAYFVDVDNDIVWRKVWVVNFEDLPKKYLPNTFATYEQNDFEPYAEKLRNYLDYHFSRQRKLYQNSETPINLVAEPPPPPYPKPKNKL